MKSFKNKILNSFNSDWLKFGFGILLCLFAIFCALSYTPAKDGFIYVSRFFNWCLSYLVGSYLAFAVYLVIFIVGLSMIFSFKKKFKIGFDLTIFGCILIVLGSLIIISNTQTMNIDGVEYLTFNNFQTVYQNTILNNFPDTELFNNSGIIGMFLVALINSGMTNIGSNVIGSIFLVAGTFFALGKISIRFTKIIIEYYQVQFGKKQLQSNDGFNLAKDVNFDTTAINTIKINKEIRKEEVIEESNSAETSTFNDVIKEVPKPIFQTKKIIDNNNIGLVKATFNENEFDSNQNNDITKERNVKTADIRTNDANIIQNSISDTLQSNKETNENINSSINNYFNESANKISDYFTIPKKEDMQVEETNFSAPLIEQENVTISSPCFDEQIIEQPISNNECQVSNGFEDSQIINNVDDNNENNLSKTFTDAEIQRRDELALMKPQNYQENEYSNKIEIKKDKNKEFKYPSSDLLENRDESIGYNENVEVAEARKEKINQIFQDLGVGASIVSYTIGPSVTQYDLQTDKNVSISGLNKYIQDVSVRLGGLDTRFVPIVQGKSSSGLEISNVKRSVVNFKYCVDELNKNNCPKLAIPFGKDISGHFVEADLMEFPHLLVCGTTGSGKSIFIHSVIMSLIMRNSPEELRLVMIDPKRVEFSKYKEIPHLMCPPITDAHKAFVALNKLVELMESRYTLFEKVGVSNIKQYNADALENGKDKLPYVVLICDEFADLMDVNKKCSEPVVRIGQKARAAGIHMIIATQRPSVNVITGVIKANLPVRVALSCSGQVDSVSILNEGGAEKLLGNGDMLIMCPLLSKQGFTRVQGSFVDNKEIKRVCDFLRENGEPDYDPAFLDLEEKSKVSSINASTQQALIENANDELYEEVKRWVVNQEYTSISKIQRTFSVGYPRAEKFFGRLKDEGIVENLSAQNNSKGSKVLVHHVEVTEQSTNPGSSEQSTLEYKEF